MEINKYYILTKSEVNLIVKSLSCTLLSKIPNDDRIIIENLIKYLLRSKDYAIQEKETNNWR